MHPSIRNVGKETMARGLGLLGRNGPRILTRRHPLLILCYHRIAPVETIRRSVLSGLCVGTDAFSRQVRFLRKHFRCLTLSDAMTRLGLSQDEKRPMAVITFDDGYADNHAWAWPALEENGVPATVFLVSRFIGTDRLLWFDEFAALWKRAEHDGAGSAIAEKLVREPGWEQVASCLRADLPMNRRIHAAINELKKLEFHRVDDLLSGLRDSVGRADATGELASLRLLRWEEAAEMAAGGIEFGSHTATHPILTRISEQRIREELQGSKTEIESRLGIPVNAFCYPNGAFDGAVLSEVRKAGYRYGCTVLPGVNRRDVDPFRIHRQPVGPRTGIGFGGRMSEPVFTAELLDLLRGRRS